MTLGQVTSSAVLMHFVVEAQSSPRWLFPGRCAHFLEEAGIRAGIGAPGRTAQLHRGTGRIPLPAGEACCKGVKLLVGFHTGEGVWLCTLAISWKDEPSAQPLGMRVLQNTEVAALGAFFHTRGLGYVLICVCFMLSALANVVVPNSSVRTAP